MLKQLCKARFMGGTGTLGGRFRGREECATFCLQIHSLPVLFCFFNEQESSIL